MLSVKFELAFKWKRLYIVGMIYKFLILCFGLLLIVLSFRSMSIDVNSFWASVPEACMLSEHPPR